VCVRYFLKASFKFCLIILENRHTRWYSIENFCHHRMYFFENERLAFCLRWWVTVLILCTEEFVWKISWLLIMKYINESIHWHEATRISNSLNRLLQEVLSWAPAIILMIFFCKAKIFSLLVELPPKNYLIFYSRVKVGIVNWFESLNAPDMDHYGITYSDALRNNLLNMVFEIYMVIYL
jgi:hypothetical protein